MPRTGLHYCEEELGQRYLIDNNRNKFWGRLVCSRAIQHGQCIISQRTLALSITAYGTSDIRLASGFLAIGWLY